MGLLKTGQNLSKQTLRARFFKRRVEGLEGTLGAAGLRSSHNTVLAENNLPVKLKPYSDQKKEKKNDT